MGKKKGKGDNSAAAQARMAQRKLDEGNQELELLLNQNKQLIDHLAQRSKDDRTRQRQEASYQKDVKEEDDLDVSSGDGEGDNEEPIEEQSSDEEEPTNRGDDGAVVVDEKLQQRNKVFFDETEKIIQQTIRDYVEK